jgi:hypothetical protein
MKIDPKWQKEFAQFRESGYTLFAPGFDQTLAAFFQLFETYGVVQGDYSTLAYALALAHGEITQHYSDKGGRPEKGLLQHGKLLLRVNDCMRKDPKLSIVKACKKAGVSRNAFYAARKYFSAKADDYSKRADDLLAEAMKQQ